MMQPNIIPKISIFDENNAKYKCCCGCMTVRTGAVVIATLNVLGVVGMIGDLLAGMEMVNLNLYISYRFGIALIYLVFEIIAVTCLIIALHMERPKFVKPQIFMYGFSIGFQLVVFVSFMVTAIFGSEYFVEIIAKDRREEGVILSSDDMVSIRRILPYVIAVVAVVFLISIAVTFWFMRTLMAYQVFLFDKLAFHNSAIINGHVHGYGNSGMEPMLGGQPIAEGTSMPMKPPAYQEVVKSEMKAPFMA